MIRVGDINVLVMSVNVHLVRWVTWWNSIRTRAPVILTGDTCFQCCYPQGNKHSLTELVWAKFSLFLRSSSFRNNAHFAPSRSVGLPRTASGRFSLLHKTGTKFPLRNVLTDLFLFSFSFFLFSFFFFFFGTFESYHCISWTPRWQRCVRYDTYEVCIWHVRRF
jgi:hypothetical protein